MKVYFKYYQHSPRVHVSHVSEMSYVPMIGDVIQVCNNEFISLNNKIKLKNNLIEFKVVSRKIRMVRRESFVFDVTIILEPLNKIT